MPRKKPTNPTEIDCFKHKDKRANIPTEELRGFVAEDDGQTPSMLYPRDPSLDPQLVWKGKDAQDQQDLQVPILPVYIQEKIHPQALIEDLRAERERSEPEAQPALFSDFNGIEFEDMVDFYQHQQNWANRMILGDSLRVMTSLAEKENLKGQVQMIYIDPPYGIKFGSNWQVSTRKRDVKDGKAEDLTRQPEQVKAFRDTWELGIHSYLSYMRDRLVVARELLTESGSIFVQIGDENVHLIRCLMDEVFGAENFCAAINIVKTAGQTDALLPGLSDTLLWYARSREGSKYRRVYREKGVGLDQIGQYYYVQAPGGQRRRMTADELTRPALLEAGCEAFRVSDISSNKFYSLGRVPFVFEGRSYVPPKGRFWTHSPEGRERLRRADRLLGIGKSVRFIGHLGDFRFQAMDNQWTDTGVSGFSAEKVYVVQTNTKVIERCLLMTTDPGDLVLDPTCGSGTTAYVAEQWGRRWITIDTSRVSLALARTRLMSARYPWYELADADGRDLRQGFRYKTVPHITLRDIAHNEEIDEIHARWQDKLEPLREEVNAAAGQSWEDWEIPHPSDEEAMATVTTEAHKPIAEWWALRQKRQAEIDKSIAEHSQQETLYDQPYEDRKRVRVCGPFTVESLSPHRVLSTREELPRSQREGQQAVAAGRFEQMIIENLRAAGVQNTIKDERLQFESLDSYAGEHLHATGSYKEQDGKERTAAVCIGPETGTVGPELIRDAAKEAVQGIGFDTLIVCGFAFDPHVSEEAKRYGKLTVLIARMNPDLSMGDEVLKKTGSGNLFMVFGEPDVQVRREGGRLGVQIKGLDIYDPTTGEIRSNTTDDIACWFIDTNYNGESFFVRHAYFTGADQPYDKLKRALRAEIDEEAWEELYSTTSRPFDPPATGRIAVKVINHYGDEVLKVYEV